MVGIISGLANMFKGFPKEELEMDKALGRWHQMYKSSINLDGSQESVYCEVAYFDKNRVMGEGGMSMLEAYRTSSKDGELHTFKRDLSKSGPGEYWMFTEDYFYPKQFFIYKLGPVKNGLYEYFIATDSNRLSLMVFARDPLIFQQQYDSQVQEQLSKGGFGGFSFWNRPSLIYQNIDCTYPTQNEIKIRRTMSKVNEPKSSHAPATPPLDSTLKKAGNYVKLLFGG
ncbi:unnamed protein product [Soboliphyme baturini]|uniref:Lipocln_cytosolic_FA-bd_dom domain-containing protein n=1 Tax=Soboliphyme baturini TaxID=241478 RepID=A0A183IXN8_9BILA|nr:unnamed protein product [Soboliphyme baturini]